ncbi:RES family NAD+ phosphorylase [Leptobacterium sp. I13]|uniref:RES family NAD+ phosphorylase n=1 Tax=Leptobacterium meishanense TaxID=3128904 RepID=UPI0030EDD8C8
MIVYRIDREKRRKELLSGIGAEKVGGRWNKPGTRAVYTAQNISLAYLEVVMHIDISEDLPSDRILIHIKIPDEIVIQEEKRLPKNWDCFPYNSQTQEIFTRFAQDKKATVLKVPSAIVASEYNYIVNPLHEDANKIQVIKIERFTFDGRLKG